MRGIVFGILTTTCCVIIFDKVLKDRGKEVVVLLKGFFKREISKLIHQGTRKGGTLCRVGNIVRQCLEEWYLGVLCRLRREYLGILFGNIGHRIVKDSIEVAFALLIP